MKAPGMIEVGAVYYLHGYFMRVEEISHNQSYGFCVLIRHGFREHEAARRRPMTIRSFQEAVTTHGWAKA